MVLKNETGIEAWINQKAEMRLEEMGRSASDWVYPYDLGWKLNAQMVLAWWIKEGNGIDWPMRGGCDQYALTVSTYT